MATKNNQNTYEENLNKLREIVTAMESDQLTLDQLAQYYEEGLALITILNQQLNSVKQRIEHVQNTYSNSNTNSNN